MRIVSFRFFLFLLSLFLGLLIWFLFFGSKIAFYKNIGGKRNIINVNVIDSFKIYGFIADSGLWTKGVIIRGNADGQYEIKPKVKKLKLSSLTKVKITIEYIWVIFKLILWVIIIKTILC